MKMRLERSLTTEMAKWRHEIHSHPEFGFDERRTAKFVADKLRSFGLDEVVEGVGGTGVVASLRRGTGNRSIGLRAEMDALRIQEASDCSYRSKNPGHMHACGHDGHTAMLLGAAKHLAGEAEFSGTVHFIFQPAEEWGRGAAAMIEAGLFERFPIDEIYAMHNWPGLAAGRFATRPGPLMAAEHNFEIVVKGRGGHAARPHQARDTLVAACAIVTGLQTIVSRCADPAATVVLSVTEFETDGTRNVLPGEVRIRGDGRTFTAEASRLLETAMRRIAEGIASAHDCTAEVSFESSFVPLINDPEATAMAVDAATAVVGESNVDDDCACVATSEDFARFLERVPGCFLLLGNGVDSPPLHNPRFDFNDDALTAGASLHVELALRRPRSLQHDRSSQTESRSG